MSPDPSFATLIARLEGLDSQAAAAEVVGQFQCTLIRVAGRHLAPALVRSA
jgi:hypothetical protein